MTTDHTTSVLIVGGGPAGLIAALQLAHHGVSCMLVERNLDTTKWPKMDVTNCRSMELFNRLGISDGMREQGVGQDYSLNVLISTGLAPGGECICQWDLPSPNAFRQKIRATNDGTMPREPYQRCSQAIFEAWLKRRIQAEPLITSYFGLKFDSLVETDKSVDSTLTHLNTGENHVVHSQYVIGCDGAGSLVRKAMGAEVIGGPVPAATLLVHFKSRDLTALHKQGQFWHIFFTNDAVIIAQDEVDTWTVHVRIPLGTDWQNMDPKEAIYNVLGGSAGRYPIEVDEILVTSSWRPSICIANHYTSPKGRVFLSGDAAHQNIPTGGYGMNTAIGDSFDIGWKLAAVLNNYGGKYLLDSYERERKPVALRNIERSGVHQKVHLDYVTWTKAAGPDVVTSSTEPGDELRKRIAHHVLLNDGENKDHGIELGYRYNGSPVVVPDSDATEPEWSHRAYIPFTWPGARVPHVFLADGETSILDLLGPDYTIVDFSESGEVSSRFCETAALLNIPLKKVHIPREKHTRDIWGCEAALIRPDDHVAWRTSAKTDSAVDTEDVLNIATGQKCAVSTVESGNNEAMDILDTIGKGGFTATIGFADQSKLEMLADFQK